MWICLCFCLGIIIDKYVNVSFTIFSVLTLLLMLLSSFIPQRKISTFLLLLAFITLGALYAKNYQTFPANHIRYTSYYDYREPVMVEGIVVSDVEKRPFFKGKKTVFTLEVKRIKAHWGWKKKSGKMLVNIFRPEHIEYGDHVVLKGKMHKPFNFAKDNQFSYREYLYRKGITFILSIKKTESAEVLQKNRGHIIKEISLKLKHHLCDVLKRSLPEKEAGIMQAFLLGDRYDIPNNVYELFKISGVAHIIAISGFNIGIVAYVIFLILKMFPIPRKGQYVLTMFLLIFYAFLTGGQPPVVRATIMAVVFLIGFMIEREAELINTLSVAALIILFLNPLNLFDVGFQLSFISVLFILLFYSKFMEIFYKWVPGIKEDPDAEPSRRRELIPSIKVKVMDYLLQSMALSLSAYFGVIVLIAYYFHLITPIVIIANLVVVPLASLIIFLGLGLLIVGSILPFVAFAFANCITVLLNLMVAVVFVFAQIPGAYFQLKNFPLFIVFIFYGLIVMGFCCKTLLAKPESVKSFSIRL